MQWAPRPNVWHPWSKACYSMFLQCTMWCISSFQNMHRRSVRSHQITLVCQTVWGYCLYWPQVSDLILQRLVLEKIHLLTNSYCVAGWRWRWKGAAEEMDDVPEGSALVFSARWRLSLQHNPRHVCAHTQSGGLEEHSVLWSLHLSVVRAFKSFD